DRRQLLLGQDAGAAVDDQDGLHSVLRLAAGRGWLVPGTADQRRENDRAGEPPRAHGNPFTHSWPRGRSARPPSFAAVGEYSSRLISVPAACTFTLAFSGSGS